MAAAAALECLRASQGWGQEPPGSEDNMGMTPNGMAVRMKEVKSFVDLYL